VPSARGYCDANPDDAYSKTIKLDIHPRHRFAIPFYWWHDAALITIFPQPKALTVMNSIPKTAAALSTLLLILSSAATASNEAADSAPPASNATPGVVVKVEKAIERGAEAAAGGVKHGLTAAAKGVKHGAEAAASGIERGAKATGHAADKVAEKIGISSTTSEK
jgi:hypothetical protein